MKKKMVFLLLLSLTVILLAGCDSQKAPAEQSPAADAGVQTQKDEGPAEETQEREEAVGEQRDTPVNETDADSAGKDEAAEVAESTWDPDFTFETVDADGWDWNDRAFQNAEVTMLNLWAYWCGPCVSEMPSLQKLSETYAEQGFQIFGVSLEEYERENVEKMKELGVSYPCLRMTDSLNEELNTGYIPATLFVDRDGHLLGELYIGARSYEDWAAILEGFLG